MESEQTAARPPISPAAGGRFSWLGLLLGLPVGVLMGLVAARIAESAQLELHFTPWILFPLLIGAGLGAIVVGLVRLGQVGHRPTIVLVTVLAVGVAVAGQHYLQYQAARQQAKWFDPFRQAFPGAGRIPAPPADLVGYLQQQAALGRPLFAGYVVRGGLAWLSWAADALLVLAAALAMVIPAIRQPYCIQCRTWYRTMRAGRIDVATARKLALLAGVEPAEQAVSARYRLASCGGGCGPTRLELFWESRDGRSSSTQSWLDAASRIRVMEVLDQMQAAAASEEGGMQNDD